MTTVGAEVGSEVVGPPKRAPGSRAVPGSGGSGVCALSLSLALGLGDGAADGAETEGFLERDFGALPAASLSTSMAVNTVAVGGGWDFATGAALRMGELLDG